MMYSASEGRTRSASRIAACFVLALPYSRVGGERARATGNGNIPQPGPAWPRIHTYLPRWQAIRIKDSAQFDRLEHINPYRLFPEHLAVCPQQYVLLFNSSEGNRLAEAGALAGASRTWSLWSGYLHEPTGKRLAGFLTEHDIPLVEHHTSGHASIDDLQRLAQALDPNRVVPIHTLGADSYDDLHPTIMPQPDGRWWDV